LNLQVAFDLWKLEQESGRKLNHEVKTTRRLTRLGVTDALRLALTRLSYLRSRLFARRAGLSGSCSKAARMSSPTLASFAFRRLA